MDAKLKNYMDGCPLNLTKCMEMTGNWELVYTAPSRRYMLKHNAGAFDFEDPFESVARFLYQSEFDYRDRDKDPLRTFLNCSRYFSELWWTLKKETEVKNNLLYSNYTLKIGADFYLGKSLMEVISNVCSPMFM